MNEQELKSHAKFKIDEAKALGIANNFFKSSTRGSSVFALDYVRSDKPNPYLFWELAFFSVCKKWFLKNYLSN